MDKLENVMDNKTKWSLAAKDGLILSLVTIVIETMKALLVNSNLPILSSLLTIIKVGLIIYLVYAFMRKYTDLHPDTPVSYGKSFSYGFLVCFFSTIICVAFLVLEYTLLFPNLINGPLEQYMTMMKQYGTTIPLDYDQIKSLLPSLIMIGQTFSCLIWGLIITSVTANWTKKDMPFFDEHENTDNNTESDIDSDIE